MRVLAVFAISIWLCSASEAALFGVGLKAFNKKLNQLNNAVQKQFSDNRLKVTGLESRVGKLEVKMKAQLGYDRSQTAGRDIKTSIVNDTGLLKSMIAGLIGIIMFLIRDASASRKWLRNALASKERYKKALNDSREKKSN